MMKKSEIEVEVEVENVNGYCSYSYKKGDTFIFQRVSESPLTFLFQTIC
jgi:uncharacterized repeat protein (TIGR04076 family)